MKSAALFARLFRLCATGACALSVLCGGSSADAAGFARDWTHANVVFSRPGPAPDARNREAFARWSKIVNDPRFRMQTQEFNARQLAGAQLAQSLPAPTSAPATAPTAAASPVVSSAKPAPVTRTRVKRDWAVTMVTGAVGAAPNGIQRYPAKWSFDTGTAAFCDNAATPDFVVYATGSGVAGAADIIAYDNLYKTTCAGAVPMVFFRYSVGGTVPSSPVFSYDGTQMAFINVNGAVASLILIKWTKNPALVTPTLATAAAYRTCTAPCYTRINLNGNPNSTGSSVFVDYNSDSIYVGDNSGRIHKFINVFVGTPSEVTGGGAASGWPIAVSTGALPSGVFDVVNNNLIIGAGARVVRIPANGGTSNVVTSATLSTACGFLSPPVVDITAGRAYFTLADYNGSGAAGTCGAATGGPAIVEFSTTFAAGAAPVAVVQLPNGTARNVNISSSFGNFDNAYYNSPEGNPSGKFYVCLYAPNPKLVQFTITSNVLSSFITGPDIATATTGSPQPSCTPMVEFFDGSVDRIFVGVYTGQQVTAGTFNCGSLAGVNVRTGCVMAYNVTSPLVFNASVTPQATLAVAGGGPSGVVIDNRSTATGAKQLYFQSIMPQTCTDSATVGWCAIQASQNGLN